MGNKTSTVSKNKKKKTMINNNTSISGDADAHHLSRCWNVQKNLSDLPCIERKMFISFKEKTYWDIEMPKEAGRDQIKLVTASGSQCYCATGLF